MTKNTTRDQHQVLRTYVKYLQPGDYGGMIVADYLAHLERLSDHAVDLERRCLAHEILGDYATGQRAWDSACAAYDELSALLEEALSVDWKGYSDLKALAPHIRVELTAERFYAAARTSQQRWESNTGGARFNRVARLQTVFEDDQH